MQALLARWTDKKPDNGMMLKTKLTFYGFGDCVCGFWYSRTNKTWADIVYEMMVGTVDFLNIIDMI